MQKTGYPILLLGFSGFVFVHDTNMILFLVIFRKDRDSDLLKPVPT